MKHNENKATYVAPSIEIIEMENEGVIAASNEMPSFGNGGGDNIFHPSPSPSRSGYNSAASSDFEDMINDILTVKK